MDKKEKILFINDIVDIGKEEKPIEDEKRQNIRDELMKNFEEKYMK